ncbi:phosphatase PAP2 family protein [Nocardioides sp. YIM 123512]|uniref:Phosphatase PAP2 family protein n=2 Tax=Nocardioides flavescens TaxID=2691959 RepID=A0A6L7EWB4_9ACTN|nr:phosphatase PAP2 family protein [Nocardioides flavescens]
MVVLAVGMAAWALIEAWVLGKSVIDPEGSFLGPSYIRLPLLLLGALLLDLVPVSILTNLRTPGAIPGAVRRRLRKHWTKERWTLVASGIISFYVVYVTYRNIKSFLPFMIDTKYDRELHLLDKALLFGHEPATVLHSVLGTSFSAHILSYVYLWFLPMVPLVVTAWVVWSRNLSYGYWFVTSQCLAWTFGTISYYLLPTLGPGFEYPQLYVDVAATPSLQLMDSLAFTRGEVMAGTVGGAVQSVAGFASLHTAITLLVALMVQYTIRNRWLRIAVWINFGITVIATLYFGWHYIADDVAGALIALASFYLGGRASGQKFRRGGLTSYPTTTTSQVPVLKD